ncbi:hypothetical protein [Evansella tamaricis]|uniref:Uncharacterized protein n=1 Tax=Evansella tamaricis TaxID=2069301 RepID=A0ABS6JML0_9BACI|nr:hypothetical protein [Evansella tamaricis]MBU9713558.1 hypothetical protein [Evansella tamaricis]
MFNKWGEEFNNYKGGETMLYTFGFTIIFAVIYMIITLTLSDVAGTDTVTQLNYGLIVGALIWIGIKLTDREG